MQARFFVFVGFILLPFSSMELAWAETPDLLALALEKNKSKQSSPVASVGAAEQAFQNGAAAATDGKYRNASVEWRKLVPVVDNGPELASKLDVLDKSVTETARARAEADTTTAGRFNTIRFTHAEDLNRLILTAQERLEAQADDFRRRKADMDKALTDRRAWVESTSLKAKTLFESGQYDEAEKYWRSLVPYWVDGPQMTVLFDNFSRLRAGTTAAQKAAAETEASQGSLLKVSPGFQQFIDSAVEKFKLAQLEARTRLERAQQLSSGRRAAVETAFEKGRTAFTKDSWTEAVEEWSRVLPMLGSEPALKASLEAVRSAYQEWMEASRQATAAEDEKNFRFPTPAHLTPAFETATELMQNEARALDLRRAGMDKAYSDRVAFVDDLFSRGKALSDAGQFQEAIQVWKTIGPYTDDEAKLNDLLSRADQAHRGLDGAKSAYQKAVLQQSSKLPSPPELYDLLDSVSAAFKKEDFEARNKTFEMEKQITDRRAWIQSTIKRGQSFFIQGRIPEAVAEWNTLVPYLEDGIDVKAKLVDLESNGVLAEKSRRILEESRSTAKLRFQSPRELSELLLTAIEDLKNQAFAAESEKVKSEQTFSERRHWMNKTFESGRSLYAEGKIAEATDEWAKLKPYLDGQPVVLELIGTLERSYEELQEAKRQAVEAAAEDYKGLKLAYSDQMVQVLQMAVKRVGDDAVALRERLDKTRGLLSERKEWSSTAFNKGKVLYEDGRYTEALEQWNRLLPYLEPDSPIKALIESYQKSLTEWSDRNAAIAEFEKHTEKPVVLDQPETMAVVLKDAADKMRAQADAALARSVDLEKQLGQRKEWIHFTFDKGKKLFDEGKYTEAVSEWGVLVPYLSEYPDVGVQIEEAKRNYVQYRKADQILQNSETKKAAFVPLPENAIVPPPTGGEIAPAAAPAPPAAEPEPAPESASAPTSAPAALTEPAPVPNPTEVAQELISGEVLSIDRDASTFSLKLFVDSSQRSVRFDATTQFDGESGSVTADSLQKGASADARVDPDNRALYVYIY